MPNGGTPGLAGAVAWVTGAASGMGARHVERLAAAGASVGCIDRDEDGLNVLVDRIKGNGGTAEGVVADVSHWSDVSAAAAALKRALGPARVVVANSIPARRRRSVSPSALSSKATTRLRPRPSNVAAYQ